LIAEEIQDFSQRVVKERGDGDLRTRNMLNRINKILGVEGREKKKKKKKKKNNNNNNNNKMFFLIFLFCFFS
jgi:hypothetical protein